MKQKESKQEIAHVKVREIQAPLVSALISGFTNEIGKDHTHEIAQKVINEDAARSGKALAEKVSGNSLEDLLRVIQEVWTKDGAMEITNISLDERRLSFDVTHCGYADVYKKFGIQELGTLMSCSRDFAFMDGFNPEIELKRTKTIMENDSICNFRYVMKS